MPKGEKSGIAGMLDSVLSKEGTGFKKPDPNPKRDGLSILEREARELAGGDPPEESSDDTNDKEEPPTGMKDLFRRRMSGESPFEKKEEEQEDEEKEEKGKEATPPKKDKEESDDPKEEEGKEEVDTELKKQIDEVLGVDLNKLTTKNGGPVNPQVTQVMKRMRSTIKSLVAENAKNKVASPADPNLENNYKTLKDAHEALKVKWEERYFEESPEFKDTYDKPVELADKEASKWLSAHEHKDGSEEKQDIDALKTLMHESLYSGDEIKFYKASDSIAELLPRGISNRFVAASAKLWEAHAVKNEAFHKKDEARKAVISKTSSFVNDASKEAVTGLDTLHSNFETMNKKILDIYKNDPKYRDIIDYQKTVSDPLDEVKKHMDHAIRSRKISTELQEIIHNGVLYNLKEKELGGLRALIKSQRDEIEAMEKKLGEKDRTLSKVRTKTSQSNKSSSDDDDDDDTPSSMKELWQKRMKTA